MRTCSEKYRSERKLPIWLLMKQLENVFALSCAERRTEPLKGRVSFFLKNAVSDGQRRSGFLFSAPNSMPWGYYIYLKPTPHVQRATAGLGPEELAVATLHSRLERPLSIFQVEFCSNPWTRRASIMAVIKFLTIQAGETPLMGLFL